MSTNPWFMKSKPSCWTTLGISTNATEAEIRSAYKSLALKQHPDKVAVANRNAATAQFQRLGAAYEKYMEAAKNPRRATVEETAEELVFPYRPATPRRSPRAQPEQ
jgi:hypothetical protein